MNSAELLDKQISRIHLNTDIFKEKFCGITETELNWRPNSESWSVGLCIEHIIKSNFIYFDLFENLCNTTYKHRLYEKTPFLANFLGSLILKSCMPDTLRKVKTLSVFEPSTSDINLGILKRFVDCNAQFANYLDKMKLLEKLDITITSPASKLVVMPLKTVFEILIYHEIRHFNQAERTLTLFREHNLSDSSL